MRKLLWYAKDRTLYLLLVSKMKFDKQLIGYITALESSTSARVKDCFLRDGTLVYIVYTGDLGKALGKSGLNIRKLSFRLGHRLRIIEFNEDPCIFVRNLFYPLTGFDVNSRDNIIAISTQDRILLGKLYGRSKATLKEANEILKRHFKDLEIVVDGSVV